MNLLQAATGQSFFPYWSPLMTPRVSCADARSQTCWCSPQTMAKCKVHQLHLGSLGLPDSRRRVALGCQLAFSTA